MSRHMLATDNSVRSSDGGFVLVVVAGLLLLLSIVAMTVMLASRSHIAARTARSTRAEASAFADGMVRLTAYRLAMQRDQAEAAATFPLDGSPRYCRHQDMVVEVRVTDTAGLIDINAARADVLEKLFIGLNFSRDSAENLTAAILDYRDTDNIPQVKGAEAREYVEAGRSYGPKNAAFDSVQELDQVLGMTPELLQTLRPMLTVYSRSSNIDPKVAPIELLKVLAQSEAGTGKIQVETRDEIKLPAAVQQRASGRRSRTRLPIMQVAVTVASTGGGHFSRDAAVELSLSGERGGVIREWSSSPRNARPFPMTDALPACLVAS